MALKPQSFFRNPRLMLSLLLATSALTVLIVCALLYDARAHAGPEPIPPCPPHFSAIWAP